MDNRLYHGYEKPFEPEIDEDLLPLSDSIFKYIYESGDTPYWMKLGYDSEEQYRMEMGLVV